MLYAYFTHVDPGHIESLKVHTAEEAITALEDRNIILNKDEDFWTRISSSDGYLPLGCLSAPSAEWLICHGSDFGNFKGPLQSEGGELQIFEPGPGTYPAQFYLLSGEDAFKFVARTFVSSRKDCTEPKECKYLHSEDKEEFAPEKIFCPHRDLSDYADCCNGLRVFDAHLPELPMYTTGNYTHMIFIWKLKL